jgi:hypothetical protein
MILFFKSKNKSLIQKNKSLNQKKSISKFVVQLIYVFAKLNLEVYNENFYQKMSIILIFRKLDSSQSSGISFRLSLTLSLRHLMINLNALKNILLLLTYSNSYLIV